MPHRTYRDSLGRTWDVWTVSPSSVERRDRTRPAIPPNPPGIERRQRHEYRVRLSQYWAAGWLAFETADEKRRLAPYPPEWELLDERELEALCARAAPARLSRRVTH